MDVYGIEAEIVHPPVDVDRFSAKPRGERLLVVSRLLPYKRVDLTIRMANHTGVGLDVVGVGPSLRELRRIAGRNVAFHGGVSDSELTELMEGSRALCVAASEDFGITALEANAAGKPVVAYADGGALETLQDGVTAAFFKELTVEAMSAAVKRADQLTITPEELAMAARQFSPAAFRDRMTAVVGRAAAQKAASR